MPGLTPVRMLSKVNTANASGTDNIFSSIIDKSSDQSLSGNSTITKADDLFAIFALPTLKLNLKVSHKLKINLAIGKCEKTFFKRIFFILFSLCLFSVQAYSF